MNWMKIEMMTVWMKAQLTGIDDCETHITKSLFYCSFESRSHLIRSSQCACTLVRILSLNKN